MIGIPLVTVCYLMTNIAYVTVVGKTGILTSGAVAMVRRCKRNSFQTIRV